MVGRGARRKWLDFDGYPDFLPATAVPAGTRRRVLAMGILSVCLSVCLSRPGGIPSLGEIETPCLHHMIA